MKKILLILVLCLSVVGISGCGGSAPKEVEIGPNTTKILEVGKDIAPGTYVVETDTDKGWSGNVQVSNKYIILPNNDGNLKVIKQSEANLPNQWFLNRDLDDQDCENGTVINLEEGQTLVILSFGNMTLKQQ